jgi:hypothetical protein
MKKLMATLIFFAVSNTFVLAQTTKHAAKSHLRHWVLNITPDSKKTYLDSVAAAWKKDSIDLKFSVLKYDNNGKLVKFKGSVEIKRRNGEDHASGTFDNDEFKSVQVEVDDGPGVDIKGK